MRQFKTSERTILESLLSWKREDIYIYSIYIYIYILADLASRASTR